MENIVRFSQFAKDIDSPVVQQLVKDFGDSVVFVKTRYAH